MALATFWVTLIGSAATLLALVVAIVLGRHEVRRFRFEAGERLREERLREGERHRRDVDRRRAQAERVSARINIQQSPGSHHDRRDGAAPLYGATTDVINASELPIWDAKVAVPHDDVLHVSQVGFIPGRQSGQAAFRPQLSRALDRQPVALSFRDAAGRWWYRCPEGHLSEENADPLPVEGDADLPHPHSH